jgi:hypothetical protein
MHAEDAVRRGHGPVNQRSFFQVGNAIKAGGDPVTGVEHVAGNLRLDGIHIVHQAWRADDVEKKNQTGCGYNDPT